MSSPNLTRALGPSAVLVEGPAIKAAAYLMALGARQVRSRDGVVLGSIVAELLAVMEQTSTEAASSVVVSPAGHGDVPHVRTSAGSSVLEPMSSAEVAQALGVSPRQVRRLARDLDGRMVGGRLVFERGAVEAYAASRKERD